MSRGRTIAVIDVGSNSVRLLVARALSEFAFEVIDEERFDARLGEGQAGGDLTPDGAERGLRAIRIMAGIARSFSPDVIAAVGTEALRRAPNAAEFLARAREEAGLDVRILSGYDEAYCGFIGVVNSTMLRDGHLVDIGGGSLEFMSVEGRSLAEVQSAPLGAIYARERYLKSDPPTPRELRSLRKAVRQNLKVTEQLPVLYGTGGAIRNLARIVRMKRTYPLRRLHGLEISRREVRRLASQLVRVATEERRKLPGVGANRPDTLHAAAVVIDEVMELSGAQSLIVAGQGLREGLVWQELRGTGALRPDVRQASIAGLARANGVDELAAEPVVHAAALLFGATSELHGLDQRDGDLLVAAARLSGIGMHVDYYNRDRHAEYLVHSGDLHGFSHREIVLLAALVRWSNTGTPDLAPYASIIEPDDSRKALVLASLLGTARAIRRRSPSPVLEIETRVKRGALQLRLSGRVPLDAEVYELERQQRRLEAVLKAPLVVETRLQDAVLA
ncbi:MAG TPA: Ppx/GppA phosphatase family protein [Tepidiformaceae bacterium]|nr:Ppx/GppA phosphatase family protein [Tepidiformaceae bacterium]